MNSEIKKKQFCIKNGFDRILSSIPYDGTIKASDVYEELLGIPFAGTPDDHHRDVFVSTERFKHGLRALNDKYNRKMTLQNRDLQSFSLPFYVRGNGIRVVSVMMSCLAIKSPFWESEKERLYDEKATRKMHDCKKLEERSYGNKLGEKTTMHAWQDPEGKILVIQIEINGKYCKPLYFEKDKVCKIVKLNHAVKESKIYACDNTYNNLRPAKYNKERENDRVVWHMRYDRIVRELLVLENDVPVVTKSEEEKENGLKEIQKPLNLNPPQQHADSRK